MLSSVIALTLAFEIPADLSSSGVRERITSGLNLLFTKSQTRSLFLMQP